MLRRTRQTKNGLSLIELLVTLSLMALLTTLGAYYFQPNQEKEHSKIIANKLFHVLQFARTEAIKRNTTITLCASSDNTTCEKDWSKGILVFCDKDNDGKRAQTDPLFLTQTFNQKPKFKIKFAQSGKTKNHLLRYYADGTTRGHGTFSIQTTQQSQQQSQQPSSKKTKPLHSIVVYDSGRARIDNHV